MAVTDPPSEADELAVRRARRDVLRAESLHTVVVLPHTEGEVAKALGDLEEVLLLANGDEELVEPLEEAVGPAALAAVGRLAGYVASVERGEPAVQPVAPDGRFELVPLHTVTLGKNDLALIRTAATAVVAAGRLRLGSEVLVGVVDERRSHAPRFVDMTEALGALLGLERDEDVDVLHGCLGSAATAGPTFRRILEGEQMAAYERVSRRILATWHRGETFAGFEYFGSR